MWLSLEPPLCALPAIYPPPHTHASLLRTQVTSRFLEISNTFDPKSLADLMWGFARLKVRMEDLFLRVFEARALKVAAQFEAHELSELMQSLAVGGVTGDNALVAKLCRRIQHVARDLTPRETANLLVAVTKMGAVHYLSDEAKRSIEVVVELHLHKFQPSELIDTVWSMAKLGMAPPAGIKHGALRRKCAQYEGKLGTEHLIKLVTSFSMLGLELDQDVSGVVQRGLMKSRVELKAKDLQNIIGAFASIPSFRTERGFIEVRGSSAV